MANRLFLSDKATPSPQYERVLQDNYHADIESVNMARTQETAGVINNWVRNQTNGLIPTLVEPGKFSVSETVFSNVKAVPKLETPTFTLCNLSSVVS